MNLQDAVLLENVLKQTEPIGDLDLIVNSPGGQGEAADQILHVCRHFCPNGRLRLIVPYFAKSAATMLAFGVDDVVMGPYSELGPTDAQVKIVEGGCRALCLASQFNGISRRHNVRDSLARYAAGRSRNASGFALASRAQACHRGNAIRDGLLFQRTTTKSSAFRAWAWIGSADQCVACEAFRIL